MYSRPTTTQLNLSRRFTFVSDSYYSFTSYISRNALKLQALSPHVHSRPTPIGQTCRDVFVFLFACTSRNTLKLQALIPHVTPDQPQSATCRGVSRLFASFPTNFPNNFSRYVYPKSHYFRTHQNTPQVHWQSVPSLCLQTQPYCT